MTQVTGKLVERYGVLIKGDKATIELDAVDKNAIRKGDKVWVELEVVSICGKLIETSPCYNKYIAHFAKQPEPSVPKVPDVTEQHEDLDRIIDTLNALRECVSYLMKERGK